MENWININRNLCIKGQNIEVDHWENAENIKSNTEHPQNDEMSFLVIELGSVKQFVVSHLNVKSIKFMIETRKEI